MSGDWKEWRAWLTHLSPEERVRVRAQLDGISSSALSQWINGRRKPSKHYVQRMAKINPDVAGSLQTDFPNAFKETVDDPSELSIPRSYFEDVIHDRATVAEYVNQYTISNKIFMQIVSQLDPDGEGLLILPAMCKPDRRGIVTCLQVTDGYGTGPWKFRQTEHSYELGKASLAGEAVSHLRPVLKSPQRPMPAYALTVCVGQIESAGAFPILWQGKVAGALLIASVQENFFNQARRTLCQSYADLYALGLFESQFCLPNCVELEMIEEKEIERVK